MAECMVELYKKKPELRAYGVPSRDAMIRLLIENFLGEIDLEGFWK